MPEVVVRHPLTNNSESHVLEELVKSVADIGARVMKLSEDVDHIMETLNNRYAENNSACDCICECAAKPFNYDKDRNKCANLSLSGLCRAYSKSTPCRKENCPKLDENLMG